MGLSRRKFYKMCPLVGEVELTSTNYKWIIPSFCKTEFLRIPGEFIESPAFSTSVGKMRNSWKLRLYPTGFTSEYKDYLSIFLYHLNETCVEVTMKFFILNDKNNKMGEFTCNNFFKGHSGYGFSQFFQRSDILVKQANLLLRGDKLTILCEIIADANIGVPKQSKTPIDLLHFRLREFDEFENLLESGKFSDVTFIVDGKECHLHKSILASKSVVFAVMFELSMKENNQNKAEISDIRYTVLKELFRFMYVGKVNQIEDIADDLLIAAEKYCINSLKELCEKNLVNKLSSRNVIQYLKFADTQNARQLKTETINFIVSNAADIIKQPEFRLMDALQMNVACEIFQALVKKFMTL